MLDPKNLYRTIREKALNLRIPFPEIPHYVSDNLKHRFYYWQKEAFENLLIYQAIKEKENFNSPTHLMFNMATGTGKTLLMAAAILYYYKQGYRNFLFFVNQNNVVDKTENNFINKTHKKYLFKNKIVIDNKTIDINQVETFSENPRGIEIKFTTIQKLYNDIHIEKENQVILEELNKNNIVMLADEAHHLNTDTKDKEQRELDFNREITGNTGQKEIERKGWEHTVINLILNKNGRIENNQNVLLEFTATIPANRQVVEKYSDKIIYKFELKQFLAAGYTKEINLISSNFGKKERILQALLFSWYREKVALKYYSLGVFSLANFKPVILFRSRTIAESKADYKGFLNIINNLQASDFDFLNDIKGRIVPDSSIYEQGKSRTRDVIEFIERENISFFQIVNSLKYSFQERNCIITNSKTNTAKTKEKTTDAQNKLLNSLEDKNNHIRAIFTVERLTEGWDVLNLYDIVRLYQGQNTGSAKKIPVATVKEKQLIGRGVRYYPFDFGDKRAYQRKFDDDIKNELRVLEELYYYTYDEESRYISHLKEELRKDGYIKADKEIKTFKVKGEPRGNSFCRNIKIWKDKQRNNLYEKKKTLDDMPRDFLPPYKIKGISYAETHFAFKRDEDKKRLKINEKDYKTIDVELKNFEKHIIDKAINIKAKAEHSFFQFAVIKKKLEIEGMEDLIKDGFLGKFQIPIVVGNNMEFKDIPNKEKLNILLAFLDAFLKEFKETI